MCVQMTSETVHHQPDGKQQTRFTARPKTIQPTVSQQMYILLQHTTTYYYNYIYYSYIYLKLI